MISEARTDYIDPEFAKTIEDRAKTKAANRAAGVKKAAETRASKQRTIDALVAALEAASGHISEQAPHEIEQQADAALALARGGK